MRALGSVPGAVAFGMVIDKTCQKWIQSCGSDSKCVLYDADTLGKYIFTFSKLPFSLKSMFYFSCVNKDTLHYSPCDNYSLIFSKEFYG